MSKKAQKNEVTLRSINAKCDRLLAEIQQLKREYVHKDMDSLLSAARECAGMVHDGTLRVIRRAGHV